MINNCKTNRWVDPAGFWDYSDMIGAKVKIKSLPVTMMNFGNLDAEQIFTIADINFRISLDGKTITVLSLEEKPDINLTFKDVEVINLCGGKKLNEDQYYKSEEIKFIIEGGKDINLNDVDFELYIHRVIGSYGDLGDCLILYKNEGRLDVLENVWIASLLGTTTEKLHVGKYRTELVWKKVEEDGSIKKGVIQNVKTFRILDVKN